MFGTMDDARVGKLFDQRPRVWGWSGSVMPHYVSGGTNEQKLCPDFSDKRDERPEITKAS